MNSLKSELIEWAMALPENCTLDDVEEFVRVRREVEAGLREAKAGHVVSHEEVKLRVAEWLTSHGLGVP